MLRCFGGPDNIVKKLLKRTSITMAVLLVLAVLLALIVVDFDSLGGSASGRRLERVEQSPNYRKGQFVNLEPTEVMLDGSLFSSTQEFFFGEGRRVPEEPLPAMAPDLSSFPLSDSSLEVIWLGHSTVLMAFDGAVLLIDPVFDDNASTVAGVAKRFQPSPLKREDLPALDAIVISHDHYDHLEMSTVRHFADRNVPFLVPLGVGAHLEAWGVPDSQISELDWSESHSLGPLELICTPARHFSGRSLTDRDQTLWSSWTILGPKHRVFYSGDTGPSANFEKIGSEYGPFDLAVIQVGAYGEDWPYIHLTPEEVIDVHLAVRGDRLLPVHWGTFDLALHDWDEPAEGAVLAAGKAGVDLLTPLLGEKVDIDRPFESRAWWRE